MSLAVYILSAALAVILFTAGGLWMRHRASVSRLEEERANHQAAIEAMREESASLTATANERGIETATLNARLEELDKSRQVLARERDQKIRDLEETLSAKNEAKTALAVKIEEIEGMNRRMADWEEAKVEGFKAVQAAALDSSQKISSKLLEDHKRETNAAKKEAEEQTKKTTGELLKRFEDASKAISVLDNRVKESKETAETVWRALSSPGGAGMYAEIGLENSLKSFGLEKGRDFLIQSQIEGKKLRPDAIVFLPGDTVLVIDAKASKFLLELAQAEETDEEEAAYKNLARTMNQHLTSLAGKNYKDGILASYREAGRGDEIKRVVSVMYLPNEGAVDKIARVDPQFIQKAAQREISVAGPAALNCMVGFARLEIDHGKRMKNQERIIELMQGLLGSAAIAVEITGKVGSGLRSASKHFASLTKSINSGLLPRMRDIASKGVHSTRNKRLPNNLPSHQLISDEAENIIDGEAEEIAEPAELPDLSGEDAEKN